jgi:ferredoxin
LKEKITLKSTSQPGPTRHKIFIILMHVVGAYSPFVIYPERHPVSIRSINDISFNTLGVLRLGRNSICRMFHKFREIVLGPISVDPQLPSQYTHNIKKRVLIGEHDLGKIDKARPTEEKFANLELYPFASNWFDWTGLRMHCVNEGPRDAPVILCAHGMPTWSIGCGVCTVTCPTEAIALVRKPEPDRLELPADMKEWAASRAKTVEEGA